MSDLWFPSNIKPLINKTYSLSRGSNVIQSATDGGLPRINIDRTFESVSYSLNFVMSNLKYQVFLSFYDSAINHGSNSFKMNLDDGTGLKEHQVHIIPNTLKISKPVGEFWYIAFDVLAQVTPSQTESCSSLYDLYQCYGDSSSKVLSSLDSFVRGLPSE